MKWNVNLLCLVGVIIGFVAILSRWTYDMFGDYNLVHIIDIYEPGFGFEDWYFSSLLVMIGVFVALVSPLGGSLEMLGSLGFILTWAGHHGEMPVSIGPYLSIASSVIILSSMIRPIGPGLKYGPFNIRSRLLTFSIRKEEKGKGV